MSNFTLKKILYFSVLIILSLYFAFFSFLRMNIRSGDFDNYRRFFNQIINSVYGELFFFSFNFEPVFYYLFFSLYNFSLNINFTLSLISIFIYIFLLFSSNYLVSIKYKYSVLVLLFFSLTFPLLFFSQSILRQGLACVFFTLYIIFKETKYSFFIYILSIMTHNIYLLYSFLIFHKNRVITYLFIFFLIILSFYYEQILSILGRDTNNFVRGNKITGIRFDFIIFSFFPFLYYFIKKIFFTFINLKFSILDEDMNNIKLFFKIFLILSIVSILFKSFPNHDRYFLTFWIYLPIIFTYFLSRFEYLFFTIGFISLSVIYQPQRYLLF